MKTIRIRKFTLLSLVFIFLLPWLFLLAAHYVETRTFHFDTTNAQQDDIDETIHLIEANTERWTESDWQSQLRSHLQNKKLDVSILSEYGKEIFQTESVRDRTFIQTEQFSILQNGNVIGKVIIYQSNSRMVQMIAAFIGLVLAFVIVGLGMRRFILKPLEEMSHRARKIAEGDFNVHLPATRIKEIAEVSDGFHVMVAGLTESSQKQEELEKERRYLITAVAHDLRTPLFALRGYLDGLEQGIAQSPEQISKYVAVCKEKSAQLDRLVEDLFTFTKMEYIELQLNENTVDFVQVLKQSINSLSPQAKQKNISIVESNVANECLVIGDAYLLERAINNLLDNAVRHTSVNGKIIIECYKESNKVIFSIQDTGKGFTSEEQRHVFDPLYRGEESRSRSTGGAGLGLTISHRIVRKHRGDLEVGNHSEGGARVTGWIPLANNSSI
ncbi:sensor histidine kinase [Ornithinibacillus salinisoli]|uniref:histidine kinase n=1 Tax=Ornithinibacillus salinisoli TaxID=1848459 RepID=A0ABW4W4C9_9BACI